MIALYFYIEKYSFNRTEEDVVLAFNLDLHSLFNGPRAQVTIKTTAYGPGSSGQLLA